MDQVNINGIEYIRKDFIIDDETKKMILDIYAIIWCEAYYDATGGTKTRDFARSLSDKISCVVKNLKLRD